MSQADTPRKVGSLLSLSNTDQQAARAALQHSTRHRKAVTEIGIWYELATLISRSAASNKTGESENDRQNLVTEK